MTWSWRVPSDIAAGQVIELKVVAEIDDTWHIYEVGAAGDSLPTEIDVKLPSGLAWAGEWKLPMPNYIGATPGYKNTVSFKRDVRIDKGVDLSKLLIKADVSFMACDPSSCLPPTTINGIGIDLKSAGTGSRTP